MKIYLDLIFIIDYFYDFIILLSTSILLKRNISIRRILLTSLVGSFSLINLFIRIYNPFNILLNILISIVMVILTFGKKNIKENIFYFYIFTIVIGGGEYLIGGDNYGINVIFLIFLVPILIVLYIKSIRILNNKLSLTHDVIIIDNDNTIRLKGYLDTGNTLVDPITKLPVIMVSDDIKFLSNKYFYVPYHVINESNILKCLKVDKVLIDSKEFDVLLGLVDKSIFNSNMDVVLNNNLLEMI